MKEAMSEPKLESPKPSAFTNTPLSAVFTLLSPDATNVAVEAVLPFSVVANSDNVATIELFSTGGSLGIVAGQSSANFSVPGTNLDVGLHPFYALVSASNGSQYRTETKWIRLLGPDAPFTVSLTAPPPQVAWPATAGRSYDILSAPAPASPFQLAMPPWTPASPFGLWTDTNGIGTRAILIAFGPHHEYACFHAKKFLAKDSPGQTRRNRQTGLGNARIVPAC